MHIFSGMRFCSTVERGITNSKLFNLVLGRTLLYVNNVYYVIVIVGWVQNGLQFLRDRKHGI